MITLNLLPDYRKEYLKLQRTYAALFNSVLIIFIIVTVVSIFILIGKIILQNQFVATVTNTTQVTIKIPHMPIDIQSINKQIETIAEIQNDFIPWPKLFIELSKITPEEISFSQLLINQEQHSLKISGFASTRSAFLAFKNNLTNNPLFVSIDSPISNLLKQKNIHFIIDVELDTSTL